MSLPQQPFKNRSRQFTSASTATSFSPPIGWFQMMAAGDITMADEAGTAVAYTGLLAGQTVPGPFSAFTSTTSSKVLLGDGPPPASATITVDAVASVSIDARVSTETSTRSAAVASLDTRVSTESSTRASAVTSLDTRVSTESSTRASADTSLTTRVSSSVASVDTRISSLIASIDA